MIVGFLILNYNSWELSSKLAKKVVNYQRIDKVVIVDNCSTDDSYEKLQRTKDDTVTVIKSEKNGGYAYGNNFGAKYCKSIGIDILFISNPDVDVDEEDINLIIDAFRDSKYAILSGIEYDINRQMSQPPIWKQMSYKDDLIDCLFIGRKLRKAKNGVELDRSMKIQEVELVKGSFLAVQLDMFLKVGGFDEGTFLFCEERILGRRMEMAWAKIGVVTEARYYHNHSVTINKAYKSIAKQLNILYKSRIYYNKVYNHKGPLALSLLRIAMKLSIMEYSLMDRIKGKAL